MIAVVGIPRSFRNGNNPETSGSSMTCSPLLLVEHSRNPSAVNPELLPLLSDPKEQTRGRAVAYVLAPSTNGGEIAAITHGHNGLAM
jgi:hypothetical protein